jgi:type I restriction enzyme, S subunit
LAQKDVRDSGTLPHGWEWATLGEVVDTTRKRVKPQERPDLNFIGMQHVEAHTMRLLGTVPASEMKSTAEYFEPGDVLYGRLRPYLNKVYSPDFEGLCSAEFIVFRKVPHLDRRYIQYFLNSWDFVAFASHLDEGDRPRVNFGQLAPYPLPLAPLSEQQRIVAEIETQFTRLEAGVAALTRAQANLRRYKASVLKAACEGRLVPTEAELARAEGRDYEPAAVLLQRILAERRAKWEAENPGKKYKEPKRRETADLPELPEGWTWGSVQQVTLNYDSLRIPVKASDREKMDGDYPYYGASGIIDHVDDYLFDGSFLLLAEDGANLLARSTPIAFQAHGRFWVNNHAHVLKTIAECPLGYLETFFNATDLKFYITGSAQPKLTQRNMNRIDVPLPPLAEQQRIVDEVERRLTVVGELEKQVEAARRRAERLRQAILKHAFEGKLVPQDPADEPASVLLARIKAERDAGEGKARDRGGKPAQMRLL